MTDCLWDNQVLVLSSEAISKLSEDTLHILSHGTNTEYLTSLSKLALEPNWTETIFSTYEPLFPDLVGRWSVEIQTRINYSLQIVTAISKILPFCPRLASSIQETLSQSRHKIFEATGRLNPAVSLLELPPDSLSQLLVLFLRLLKFDQHEFSSLTTPVQIQELCSHPDLHIRYLACQVLGILLHFTTKAVANYVERHCGTVAPHGDFDGKHIDFRFFDMWEDQRLQRLQQLLDTATQSRSEITSKRIILETDLCPQITSFAGYLAIIPGSSSHEPDTIVATPVARRNLKRVAESICSNHATLIIGTAGSGKTLLIDELAKRFQQSSRMLTLYLNAQTDAKLLIGLYTTVVETGAFKWQPGVLTKAVLEGRWVVIEDLDRAPSEVISVLLPLLDTGQLVVPNLGGPISVAPGFKLIATIRSRSNTQGEDAPTSNILGLRHWNRVVLEQYSSHDVQQIISTSFPLLRLLSDRLMRMYNAVNQYALRNQTTRSGIRPPSLQDLLRFCKRSSNLLKESGMSRESDAFPDSVSVQIFLEAIDSFCTAIPVDGTRLQMTEIIAQELYISAENVRFCIELRVPSCEKRAQTIKYGRVELKLQPSTNRRSGSGHNTKRPFAQTNHSLKVLESVASAVKFKTPCLLVGETGTGKTTIVQNLADAVGQKLVVVNLSQQSEVGDLFGGFKPVTLRALATPIKDEFDALFDATSKSNKNEEFLTSLNRNFAKSKWSRVLRSWQEASKAATIALDKQVTRGENPSKKRKIDAGEGHRLSNRWQQLNSDIEVFRKHLESGSKGFAFSYMEGNLVKAVRHGYWILLDEINLAPHDTLESLADLLPADSHRIPSILLTDSGDIQRIKAHPDFRVFAAMNPATDVGKRDLPPGIRSRFTEYYVSSCEGDPDSLVQICSAYLGEHTLSDRRIAHDVTRLYQSIRTLEKDNHLVDGAGQKPHFTLRSLSRTLVYAVDIANIYGLRRSLFEGFCMSFLTLLDRTSTGLVSPLIHQHLLAQHKNVKSILHQIPKCPGENSRYVQFKHYWMVKGSLPVVEQPHYIITPFVEANLLNLVRATSSKRYPILLQGPTSSGKTSMIEYLAKISGNNFVRINNHEHTDLQEYLGTYVSGSDGLIFQDGLLVKALREGHWLVLDELNLAPTDVLEALNRLLDDNRELLIPETQELVHPHPDFMLFATQNPPGMYGGRKVLSRAFRNRFLELHFDDIPEEELETILRERSQIAPSFCTRIVEVYKRLAILRQTNRLFEQKNSFATLRDLFRWAFRDADNVEQLAINGFMLLCERVRDPIERTSVKSIIEEVMRIKIEETKLYNFDESQKKQIKRSGDLAGGISMTKAMSRLYTLVSAALKHNEPVLLIGNTGCGKTTVCQIVAESMGTKLHILNAHQNTETGDIIGAQRPVRNRQQTASDLQTRLRKLLKLHSESPVNGDSSTEDLIARFEALSATDTLQISTEPRHEIESLITRYKALFEWADGILVTAMRSGYHFLLDEISLADDSVLERLNSVLEPSRSLLLAEKGSTDTTITAHDNFQFLATMNPGGDYGKKELSPALRNRFTEIWVPDLADEDDTLAIVSSKLSNHLRNLARPIVAFATWFDQFCGENRAAPSLRQILAFVEFLNLRHGMDANTAFSVVHGAAMVYIDGIGTDPAAKLYLTQDDVNGKRHACLDQLANLFGISARDIYYSNCDISISKGTLSIGPFSVMGDRNTAQSANFSFEAPTTISNTLRVIRGLQIPKPILIEGSPGVGKTSLIEVIAQIIGIPLTRINLSEQTDLMDLFGSDVPVENGSVGQFEWRDAPFLTAMQKGEWVLLDEMNLASQSVLEGLNACLDHRGQIYVPELDRSFNKHAKFTLFAAQNPHGQGGGRKGLPASFVNRFTLVYADSFTAEDLIQISASMFPSIDTSIISSLASHIFSLNSFIADSQTTLSAGGPWEFNLRDLMRWLTLISKRSSALSVAKPRDFEDMLVLGRFRSIQDVKAIITGVHPPFPESDRSRTRFQNTGTGFIQCGYGFLQKSLTGCETSYVPEGKDLAVLESVMIAVEQNWPCLLVGPSGSGKSRLLHGLASTFGTDVVTLALNNAMDSTDILGGYEQVDYTRHLRSLLFDIAKEIQYLWAKSNSRIMTAELAAVWLALQSCEQNPQLLLDQLNHPTLANCAGIGILFAKLTSLVQQMKDRPQAQFEWVDGALIKALERGSWLILDNANLCNASVLDRLNALLEPNGLLSLNEHRLEDGSSRIVSRHTNFRLFLTMDPRHGELSRAMRNRCIEVFQTAIEEPADAHRIDYSHFARQPGLNILSKFDWNRIPSSQSRPLLDMILSRQSIAQCLNFGALLGQVSKGLYGTEGQLELLLRLAQQTFAVAFDKPSIVQRVEQMHIEYLQLSNFEQKDLEVATTEQPLDFTTNTALLSLHAKRGTLSTLVSLFELIEARLKLASIRQDMIRIRTSLPQKREQDFTRIERSMRIGIVPRFSKDLTAPMATMLDDLVKDQELQLDVEYMSRAPMIHATMSLVELCQDLLDFTNTIDADTGKLFAYLRLSWKLVHQQELSGELSSSYEILRRKLVLFGNVSINQDMETLWHHFKPDNPRSLEQISRASKLKEIALQLDNVAWKSSIPIKKVMELKALVSSIAFQDGDESLRYLHEVQELVHQRENDKDLETVITKPYFKDVFAMLKQYTNMGALEEVEHTLDEVSVLACEEPLAFGSSDRGFGTNQSVLFDLCAFTGSFEHSTYLGAVRGDLSACLMRKLGEMMATPLRRFSLLQEEMPMLCKHISTRTSQIVDDPYWRMYLICIHLAFDILAAHQHLLEPTSFTTWSTYLRALLDDIDKFQLALPSPLAAINHSTSHQASIIQDILLRLSELLTRKSTAYRIQHVDWQAMAEAWIQFSITCLKFYVPDHPFDPALGPRLIHERWQKRKLELENQLTALQLYEDVVHGQPVDFRRRLLQDKLDCLGVEPTILPVARPKKSQILDLHTDLLNIQRTILNRIEHERLPGLLQSLKKVDELQRHVQMNVKRLAGYEGYHDITKPAIGFLQALNIGLSLLSLSKTSESRASDHEQYLHCSSNLFGFDLKQILQETSHRSLISSISALDHRYIGLIFIGLCQIIEESSSEERTIVAADLFHQFYEEWKEKLSQEQTREAAQSSLYHFQGNSESSNTDDADIQTLFPTFDQGEEKPTVNLLQTSPAALAQLLADLQAQLFSRRPSNQAALPEFVMDVQRRIFEAFPASKNSFYPFTNTNTLPGVLLALDARQSYLTNADTQTEAPDFYNEPNLPAARKLIVLCRNVRLRFRDIQEAWPEHAIPSLVIQTVEEILDCKHSESLAKLITLAEKLHSYVHEWQSVSSREFSAAALYDELTQLIISWRRIELSSWSQLLDREERNHSREAKSWWFIAYEAILKPLFNTNVSPEEACRFSVQLSVELQKFIMDTNLGQFTSRLEILANCGQQAAAMSKLFPAFLPVSQTLSSTVDFFARWQARIQDEIKQQRTMLDKKMRDIILLASWKDTNIEALRASSRRSHNTLFKVVKKYREILATAVKPLLSQAPSYKGQPEHVAIHIPLLHFDSDTRMATSAYLQYWSASSQLSRRIISPLETASLMARVGKIPESNFQPVSWVIEFNDYLHKTIKSLQQETPSKLTVENKALVKQLKTQKRKLLFDTLKVLKQMGLRSNLNANVLQEQDTVSKILASLVHRNQLSDAREDFYVTLDNLSQIRNNSSKYTDDLSSQDIARCLGFFEGMLFQLMDQHHSIQSSLEELSLCDSTLTQLHKLWQPSKYTVLLAETNEMNMNTVAKRLRWLIAIVRLAAQLIRTLTKMGQEDFTSVLDLFHTYETNLVSWLADIKEYPNLSSAYLKTSNQVGFLDNISRDLQQFSDFVADAIQRLPNLRFILVHVLPWLDLRQSMEIPLSLLGAKIEQDLPETHGLSPIEDIDLDDLDNIVKQMLVGLQQYKAALEELPESDDETSWLINHDKALRNAERFMRITMITNRFHSILLPSIYPNEESLAKACIASGLALPVLQQYRNSFGEVLDRRINSYISLCRLANTLSGSLKEILTQGFCTPKKESATEEDPNQTEGVGLGEGEGAEDISKDIQDDEDLTELAQNAQAKQENDPNDPGLDKEDNAVDLGDDDLEGQLDSEGEEHQSGEEEGEDEDKEDVSEEVGDVDSLDPAAVDEKLWEEEANKEQREKEGKANGKRDKDNHAELENNEDNADTASDTGSALEDLDEHSLDTENKDTIDPHVDKGENLELPEDMQMDSSKPPESDEDSMDGMSELDEPDNGNDDGQAEADQDEMEMDTADVEEGNETGQDEDGTIQEPPNQSDEEQEANENAEEDTKAQHDQTTLPNNNEIPQPNDRLGSGTDAALNEHEENETRGDHQDVGMNASDSKAEESDAAKAVTHHGELAQNEPETVSEKLQGNDNENQSIAPSADPFRKLGEALEKWRRSQQIHEASQQSKQDPSEQYDDVQHLEGENDRADAQVLGAAADNEVHALTKDELEMEVDDGVPDAANEANELDKSMDSPDLGNPNPSAMDTIDGPDTFIGHREPNGVESKQDIDMTDHDQEARNEETVDEIDIELSEIKLQASSEPGKSIEEARKLWQQCEMATKDLSLILTEQLRLILAPSLATKMRGDFRTGKRLNIKRIIPYIASGYKRDKIWMRRSVPSKRAYQVMLAVDDSKSMTESGGSKLAFEALALLSRSLSMLEVGQICIASFGEHFRIAHDFDQQFSTETAVNVFQHFDFNQTKTNVHNLMSKSLDVFREARMRQTSSSTDLWQLQLIISDGVCEDHEAIRRLVRQAHEERIMIVFAVINSAGNHSILNMTQASFEPDENGETKLKIKRYLEGFPFPYYLIVGDVKNLPGVLSTALRQWFAEVTES